MDISNYIDKDIFGDKPQHLPFYRLMWDNFIEDGFVITDENGNEIDAVIKAVALKNLLGEFIYRLYDEVNDTSYEDIIEHIQNVGFSEDDVISYCQDKPEIEIFDDDNELTIKSALDYISEITANQMLEDFSADDLFDLMFTSTYDFEQDFVFDFEDYEELQSFVDSNQDQLDNYKEEYPSVLDWINYGMVC